MATTTIGTHAERTLEGVDAYGEEQEVTVWVEDNPEWSADTGDSDYRLYVRVSVDGDEIDYDGYDDLGEALAYAEGRLQEYREEHEQNAADLAEAAAEEARQELADRGQALVDAAEEWDGAAALATRALAALVASGRADEALAALRAAGLA